MVHDLGINQSAAVETVIVTEPHTPVKRPHFTCHSSSDIRGRSNSSDSSTSCVSSNDCVSVSVSVSSDSNDSSDSSDSSDSDSDSSDSSGSSGSIDSNDSIDSIDSIDSDSSSINNDSPTDRQHLDLQQVGPEQEPGSP